MRLDRNPPTTAIRLRMGAYVRPSNKATQHCCHRPKCRFQRPPGHPKTGMINPSIELPESHESSQNRDDQSLFLSSPSVDAKVQHCIHFKFDVDFMHKCTSFVIVYRPTRDSDGDETAAATTSYVGVKPLMCRRTSFLSHCVLLSTSTTYNCACNMPSCASAQALYFGNDGKEC